MKERMQEIKSGLLSGVSYMLPFVIAGGILIALGFGFGGTDIPNSVDAYANLSSSFYWIGNAATSLMIPVLGAYVAYSIADKPALVGGMVGGYISNQLGAGFLGALLAGLFVGYFVKELKKIKLPNNLKALLPTLIIPILSVTVTGVLMVYLVGKPIAILNEYMIEFLNDLGTGSAILLGIIHGCMCAFDMGGPLNKASYAFALSAAASGNYIPMSTAFVAAMVPPLAIALAIMLKPKLYNDVEKSSVPGLLIGGCCQITEFAIPFAAANPLTVIPALMIGSATGGALCYSMGLTITAPYGGLFVAALCNEPILLILNFLIGGVVGAFFLIVFKNLDMKRKNIKIKTN